LTYHHKYPSLN